MQKIKRVPGRKANPSQHSKPTHEQGAIKFVKNATNLRG
jgi:hypothetical protein